ncbi:hypothetical protein ACF0H5_020740 [Mactra antiquata]
METQSLYIDLYYYHPDIHPLHGGYALYLEFGNNLYVNVCFTCGKVAGYIGWIRLYWLEYKSIKLMGLFGYNVGHKIDESGIKHQTSTRIL